MSKVLIGTSGWTYDGWRGPFYPEGRAEEGLALPGTPTQFPTTEINGVVLPHAVARGRARLARPDAEGFPVRLEGIEIHHPLEAAEREVATTRSR